MSGAPQFFAKHETPMPSEAPTRLAALAKNCDTPLHRPHMGCRQEHLLRERVNVRLSQAKISAKIEPKTGQLPLDNGNLLCYSSLHEQ
jgi:hypothetical protein